MGSKVCMVILLGLTVIIGLACASSKSQAPAPTQLESQRALYYCKTDFKRCVEGLGDENNPFYKRAMRQKPPSKDFLDEQGYAALKYSCEVLQGTGRLSEADSKRCEAWCQAEHEKCLQACPQPDQDVP